MEQRAGTLGARRRKPDVGLALLVLFVGALNYRYLDPRILPIHDTFANFVDFHIFYNQLFFERDLAHWLPYCDFGLPADFQQIIALTPVSYVVGLAGALARVPDAMLVFKLSVIGEQLVFAIGTYLFARRAFVSRAPALALGVAAAGTVVWYAQLWFELRFFYGLPWVLYCLAAFLDERRPAWLWLAAVASVAWSIGNLPYFVPVWGFVLLICLAGAVLRNRSALSHAFPANRTALLLALAFTFGAGVYVYFALHALDHVYVPLLGRDPQTGGVDAVQFGRYGGEAHLPTVASSLLLARPIHLPWGSGADNSVYVGLLPLLAVAVAAARERSGLFLGMLAAIGALVWLSVGGAFATFVYHLPALSQYRHVGLVYGLVKALGLLAAGWGLERLCRVPAWLPPRRVLWLLASGLIVASAAVVPLAWSSPLLLRLWLYAVAAVASVAVTRSLGAGLVVGLALDLVIYQGAVYRNVPKLPPGYVGMLDALRVHELAYQPSRYTTPASAPWSAEMERAARALRLAEQPGAMGLYWFTYGFAQFDPCWSRYLSEMKTMGVESLGRVEWRRGRTLSELTGCHAPKLRVVAGPTVVEHRRAAREALLAPSDAEGRVRDVVRVAPGSAPVGRSGTWVPEAGAARVTRFTLNELVVDVHVAVPDGAWLVYADAFYPGWHAAVDGREVPVAEANLAFKAVWVPAGDHGVRLWYRREPSRTASYALAGFGLGCGLALIVGVGVAMFPRAARRSAVGAHLERKRKDPTTSGA